MGVKLTENYNNMEYYIKDKMKEQVILKYGKNGSLGHPLSSWGGILAYTPGVGSKPTPLDAFPPHRQL